MMEAHEGFATWAGGLPSHSIWQAPENVGEPFLAKVEAWMLGDLIVNLSRMDAFGIARTAEQIGSDAIDHYVILLMTSGSSSGTMDGRPFAMGPGQLTLQSLSQPIEVECGAAETITLRLARDTVEAAVPNAAVMHGGILEGATARLLADHLQSLVRRLDSLDENELGGVAAATAHLALATLKAQKPDGAVETSARQRVRRYIDDHLAASTLSPETICDALGIARATLYRNFPVDGGIAAYIVKRRLEAIHVRLNDPAEQRTIASIAYGYGFASSAHFTRAFRKQFGYSPREFRKRLVEAESAANGDDRTAQFRRWIDLLD